ncbi:hypothetical protein [Bacillus sp. LL01]|uniref:hypothetical protein n=1 Tax=Bacillus sp. LL01 TaxID=1665556 RepID=UPI000A8CB40C|nr:hypothetical protein [Bacillus sp. LL01]
MLKNQSKDKELLERNEKEKAFKENEEKQKNRDQLVMPIDELPLEEIKYEEEEERDKKGSKDRSTSKKN